VSDVSHHDITDTMTTDTTAQRAEDATQPTESDADVVADSGGSPDLPEPSDTSSTLTLPEGLIAEAPPANKPLPDFAGVLDTAGEAFNGDQLLGSWTVIWFYPLALTAG